MPPPTSPPRRSRPPSFSSLSSSRPPLHPTRQEPSATFDTPQASETEAIRMYRRASLRRFQRNENPPPPADQLERLRTLAFEAVHDADIGSDVLASGYRSQAIRRRLLRAAALNNPRRRRLAESAPTPPASFRRRLNLPEPPGLFPMERMDLDNEATPENSSLAADNSDSDLFSSPRTRQSKRRKYDHQTDTEFKPIQYGWKGQVDPGQLKLEMVHCDGGEYDALNDDTPDDFEAENVLQNDSTVYCSKLSKCNILLKHQSGTIFHISKLIIKAPETGYTAPLTQGLVFVGMSELEMYRSAAEYQVSYRNGEEPIPRPPLFITDEDTRTRHQEMLEYLNGFVGQELTDPPSHIPSSIFPTGLGIDWSRFDWQNFNFENFLNHFPDFFSRFAQRHMLTHPERVPLSDFMRSLGGHGYSNERESSPVQVTTAGPEWDSEMEEVDCDGHSDNGDGIDIPLPIIHNRRLNPTSSAKTPFEDVTILKPNADFYLKTGKNTAAIHFTPPLSGRFILLKMFATKEGGNIDVQYIGARGYSGKRFFPSITMT